MLMNDIKCSDHASLRMRQRGLRERDIDVILFCGTQIDEASILLSNKDADREIRRRKREIQQLERLRGCQVVVANQKVLTCYHSEKQRLKRKMRRRR